MLGKRESLPPAGETKDGDKVEARWRVVILQLHCTLQRKRR
jgi:hypothetical protein